MSSQSFEHALWSIVRIALHLDLDKEVDHPFPLGGARRCGGGGR